MPTFIASSARRISDRYLAEQPKIRASETVALLRTLLEDGIALFAEMDEKTPSKASQIAETSGALSAYQQRMDFVFSRLPALDKLTVSRIGTINQATSWEQLQAFHPTDRAVPADFAPLILQALDKIPPSS